MKYTAHTIDGTLIYQRESYYGIAHAAIEHIEKGLKPNLAYTYREGDAFPYVTWHRGDSAWIGNPCRNFDEVISNIRKGI